MVFVTNHYNERKPDGLNRTLTQQEKVESVAAFVARFQAAAGKVVFISPAPAEKKHCYVLYKGTLTCYMHVYGYF